MAHSRFGTDVAFHTCLLKAIGYVLKATFRQPRTDINQHPRSISDLCVGASCEAEHIRMTEEERVLFVCFVWSVSWHDLKGSRSDENCTEEAYPGKNSKSQGHMPRRNKDQARSASRPRRGLDDDGTKTRLEALAVPDASDRIPGQARSACRPFRLSIGSQPGTKHLPSLSISDMCTLCNPVDYSSADVLTSVVAQAPNNYPQ